jgi:Tfp pilus assembly protein PilF
LLIAATVFFYAPVGWFEFVNWDDPHYVTENQRVLDGLTWRNIQWAFTTGHAANWHPVTWMSHMLDAHLFGLHAGAHHLHSLLLHVVNTLLLFGLFHRMTAAMGRSAFMAALFAVHPLHVESVAWIAERKDVLSTFFWILCLWAYFWYARQPNAGRYLIVALWLALGLMAKPMLVTLPFVLLLLDYWPLGRTTLGGGFAEESKTPFSTQPRSVGFLVLEKLPLLLLAAASSTVTFIVQRQGGAVSGLDTIPLQLRLENAVVAYVVYIGKMIWPQHLAVVYPYSRAIPTWQVVGAALVLLAVSAMVIRYGRRYGFLPVGWYWYLGTLVPVIGIVQVGSQPWADRYSYVPSIGLSMMVAWGIHALLKQWSYRTLTLSVAGGLVILGCMGIASGQVRHWRNSHALWSHALEVSTGNFRAHNNLGNVLDRERKIEDAMAHYAEALRLNPDFVDARNNLGNVLWRQGRLSEAAAQYLEALRVKPDYAEAHNGLGSVLDDQGKVEEAITHFREAVRLNPELHQAHNNLGTVLGRQGKVDEAIRAFEEALRLRPDQATPHYNIAVILDQQGKTAEAIQHLERALLISPDDQNASRALSYMRNKIEEGGTGTP